MFEKREVIAHDHLNIDYVTHINWTGRGGIIFCHATTSYNFGHEQLFYAASAPSALKHAYQFSTGSHRPQSGWKQFIRASELHVTIPPTITILSNSRAGFFVNLFFGLKIGDLNIQRTPKYRVVQAGSHFKIWVHKAHKLPLLRLSTILRQKMLGVFCTRSTVKRTFYPISAHVDRD
jgi:hypothetical protein